MEGRVVEVGDLRFGREHYELFECEACDAELIGDERCAECDGSERVRIGEGVYIPPVMDWQGTSSIEEMAQRLEDEASAFKDLAQKGWELEVTGDGHRCLRRESINQE